MDPNDLAKYAIVIIIIYILYQLIKEKPVPITPSTTTSATTDPQEQFYKDFYASLKIPASDTNPKHSFKALKQEMIEGYEALEKAGCVTEEKQIKQFMDIVRDERLLNKNSPRMIALTEKLIKDKCALPFGMTYVIQNQKIMLNTKDGLID